MKKQEEKEYLVYYQMKHFSYIGNNITWIPCNFKLTAKSKKDAYYKSKNVLSSTDVISNIICLSDDE